MRGEGKGRREGLRKKRVWNGRRRDEVGSEGERREAKGVDREG